VSQLRATLGQRFEIMSGDDSLTLSFMAVGAQGVISVASNIIPNQVARMVKAFGAGKSKDALALHQKYYPLFKDLFLESNPVPVKAALAMLGRIQEEYRLPLVKMSEKNRRQLKFTMKACGLLK
jgi:4-hydroxy-tetrahydrodipicolinate synthase